MTKRTGKGSPKSRVHQNTSGYREPTQAETWAELKAMVDRGYRYFWTRPHRREDPDNPLYGFQKDQFSTD